MQGTIPNDHGSLEEQADSSSSIWAFMNRITGCPKTYPNFEKSKSTIHVNIYIYDVFELGNSSNEKTPLYSPITIAMRVATTFPFLASHLLGSNDTSAEREKWRIATPKPFETPPRSGRWWTRCQRLERRSWKKYSTLEIQHGGSRKWGLEVLEPCCKLSCIVSLFEVTFKKGVEYSPCLIWICLKWSNYLNYVMTLSFEGLFDKLLWGVP